VSQLRWYRGVCDCAHLISCLKTTLLIEGAPEPTALHSQRASRRCDFDTRGSAPRIQTAGGFRWYWTCKLRHGQAGRPRVPKETRELKRAMSRDNVRWGAPRMYSELQQLGKAWLSKHERLPDRKMPKFAHQTLAASWGRGEQPLRVNKRRLKPRTTFTQRSNLSDCARTRSGAARNTTMSMSPRNGAVFFGIR
jgi:hypothetical protein